MIELVLSLALCIVSICFTYIVYQQTLYINEVNKRLLLMISEYRDYEQHRMEDMQEKAEAYQQMLFEAQVKADYKTGEVPKEDPSHDDYLDPFTYQPKSEEDGL